MVGANWLENTLFNPVYMGWWSECTEPHPNIYRYKPGCTRAMRLAYLGKHVQGGPFQFRTPVKWLQYPAAGGDRRWKSHTLLSASEMETIQVTIYSDINLNLKFSSISPFDLEFHIALTSSSWAWTATEMFTAIHCSKIEERLVWLSKPSKDHSDAINTGASSAGASSLQMFALMPPSPRAA